MRRREPDEGDRHEHEREQERTDQTADYNDAERTSHARTRIERECDRRVAGGESGELAAGVQVKNADGVGARIGDKGATTI